MKVAQIIYESGRFRIINWNEIYIKDIWRIYFLIWSTVSSYAESMRAIYGKIIFHIQISLFHIWHGVNCI